MEWLVEAPLEVPKELESLSLNPITLQLLLQRGFFSKEQARKFLTTHYEDLYSPSDLSGISKAVSRIGKAKDDRESVTVFGDYDADGITSTVLLKESLKEIGINPSTYIPDRNREGYGLNKKAIDLIKKEYKTKLLVTVDCGISNQRK